MPGRAFWAATASSICALLNLGLIDEPLTRFIYSANGIVITLTYFLLPFAVLPIYGSMRAIRDVTLEAARDLGAGVAGGRCATSSCRTASAASASPSLFTFLISVGDYVTPRFVGGGAAMMGHFIEAQFSFGFNWPMGSAMAFTLMAASLLTVFCCSAALLRQWLKP